MIMARKSRWVVGYHLGRRDAYAMAEEKEIREVMRGDRANRTSARQKADLKNDMLRAIRECDEAAFMYAIAGLGHEPGSELYEQYRKRFREHVARRHNP